MKSGKRKPQHRKPCHKKRLRLGKRDRCVLKHLADYRHSWPEVLHAAHYSQLQPAATTSTLRRLFNCEPPLVRAHPLYDRRVYYQLTYAGTRAIGASHRKAEALGRMTILRQFALQSFLFLSEGVKRRLLSKQQLAKVFDLQGKRPPQSSFYLASSSTKENRFGVVLVDYGSDARRCGQRVVKRALQLMASPQVRGMAAAQLLEISFLTMTSAKRQALYQRLQVSKRTGGMMHLSTEAGLMKVRLKIHVIPGLLKLVPDSRE